ncbi:N-acyl-D-amino-acid deacylase family protein [Roseiterribacter gracilis]|uniref:Aminoacylase n=1 Tax=Roseiterribacter gracilis TaxID=2812848 RepID=A0A8S8XC66_9PROT|nr:aminoacylase [Rhodospirillales bacterium TMPK1]
MKFAALLALTLSSSAFASDYDLVIRNGRLLDGAGNPWVAGDLAIKNGRIAAIGRVQGLGKREIEAAGRYVAPGFIDMMDQSGDVLPENGDAVNKLQMGVTTVISGESGTPVKAAELPKYFRDLERKGIAVNFGTYYNATDAREHVMGDGAGAPSQVQLQAMRDEIDVAMKAGVFGITTALIYPPATFQTTDELVELAKVAGRCGGFYATHMRDESADLLRAIDEAVAIGERGGVKVEIFHLKAAYAPQWGRLMPEAVQRIAQARARGIDIAADMYPYTAAGTGLSVTVPSWVFADGRDKGMERLRDPAVRERIKREVASGSLPGWSNLVEASGGWGRVLLGNPQSSEYERFRGKSMVEIGAALGKDPADTAWDIVLAALPKRATGLYFMMDERDVETALRQSWTSIGTDAPAVIHLGSRDEPTVPHPRVYGTFPRVLAEYVKRRGVLSLEDAVRKMTSWPASRMGLVDRGVLREGLRADLVIFDMARIDDTPSYEKHAVAPQGIDYVLVNGKVTLENGAYTGAKAGRVLRHACN